MSLDLESPTSSTLPTSEALWRRALASRGLQLVVAVLVVGGLGWNWATAHGGIEVLRERLGLWAALPLMLLQASVTVTPFPDEVIGFANSVIHGFAVGALLNWVAWMLGALIEYAVARRSARDLDFQPERLTARLPLLLRRVSPGHPAYLILARQVPFGGHIVNSWAGAFGIPLWRFVWTAAIGSIPGSLVIAGAANGLVNWAG